MGHFLQIIKQFGNQRSFNIPRKLKVFQNYYKQRNTQQFLNMLITDTMRTVN